MSKFDQKLHIPPNDMSELAKSADDDISSSSPFSSVQHLINNTTAMTL